MNELKIRTDDAGIRITNTNRLKTRIIQRVFYKAKNTVRANTEAPDEEENYTSGTVPEAAEEAVFYAGRSLLTGKTERSFKTVSDANGKAHTINKSSPW